MNDSRKAQITSRIKTVAAVARARAEVRAGLHRTASEHLPDVGLTVQCSELSLLVTPYYGDR